MHSMQGQGPLKMLGVHGALTRVKVYECGHCKGFHDDDEEVKYIKLRMFEIFQEFCYLGDIVGSSNDVQRLVTLSTGGWRKFSKMSCMLRGRVLSLKMKGCLFKSCVRSVMMDLNVGQ